MIPLRLTMTALATPFRRGEIDEQSLGRLVEHQLRNGIEGFVVNGTTAESPTLSREERDRIFSLVRQRVGPQFPLVLGTGSNSTEETIEATREAEALGADAALVVVPYYNKPPQRGLYEHFKRVASSTKLPVYLYNVPGRTITSLEIETIRELSKVENILGIKEASGRIDFDREIATTCGSRFTMLSGDDGTYAEFLGAGGHGIVSVASHLLPADFVAWTKAARRGDFAVAREEIKRYSRLIDLLFCEANPIPVKMALKFMGLFESAEMRLPLVEMEPSKAEELRKEMVACGMIR